MEIKPVISVIMPVYNNEKYFPIAVESVLKQEFENIELIIIDDGSNDRTPLIADEIATHDQRVKVLHQENQWIYASFNHGIEAASGEYIYILNSDDKLRDGALSLLGKFVEKYHPDVIWTKVLPHVCDEEQRILQYDVYGYDKLVREDVFFEDKFSVRKGWLFFYQSKLAYNQANLYRRSTIYKHKFRNDVYGADQLFNISIAQDIHSAFVLSEPVYDHFLYISKEMNASQGKYYGYEHEMFNEIYMRYVELFQRWSLYDTKTKNSLAGMRLSNLTNEIRSMGYPGCKLSIEEKIRKIFTESLDEIVYNCALEEGRLEELHGRVLSGCREILCKGDVYDLGDYQFVFEYLDCILRYEKTEEDFKKIEDAVYHKNNPYHIGLYFYNKLAEN